MGFALLFIESLISSLLLVATVMACAAGWRRRWLRVAVEFGTPLVLLSLHVALTAVAAHYQFRVRISSWFYPTLALTVCFLLGTVWLLFSGLRRADAEGFAVAATWPRGKLAMALAAAVALCCMTFWNLDLAARQQLAALRVEAGALALALAPPQIPDRENAAPVYQRAFEAMGRRSEGDETGLGAWQWEEAWAKAYWGKWVVAVSPKTGKIDIDLHDPELRRFLERQAPAMKLLRQAASMPGCRFDRIYLQPDLSRSLLPTIAMQTATQILALDTFYSAANGDYRQAVEDINAGFRMAEHFGSHPSTLLDVMLAVVMERSATYSLQVVLATYPIPPGDLAAVKIPDNESYRELFARAFRYELARSLMAVDGLASGRTDLAESSDGGDRPNGLARYFFPPVYRVFLLTDDVAAFRRYSAEQNEAVQLPYWRAKDRVQEFEKRVQANPGGMLTSLCLISMSNLMAQVPKAEARRDAARLGLALCAYRTRNGKFPAKLDDLVPEFIASVPLNPYDGEPMKIERTERGLTVYSVGPLQPNRDGGFFSDGDQGDITFTVPDAASGTGEK